MQSIHAFPDSRHYADDIIWAGNEDEGFATSHRAINVGHHLGPWRWGEPTGNKINLWVIANCVSEENEIFEEWVLYNDGRAPAPVRRRRPRRGAPLRQRGAQPAARPSAS